MYFTSEMKVALLPSIPPAMLSYPPSTASVCSHSDEAHGRVAAIVETPNGTPGVGLVEIYQIS